MEEETVPVPDFAAAIRQLQEMMLGELVHALLARGALRAEDVAGMLLRVEKRATSADEVNDKAGKIMPSLAVLASATTEEWDNALGLKPDLYTLRKRHKEWLASGQWGKSPYDPYRVVEFYAEDD